MLNTHRAHGLFATTCCCMAVVGSACETSTSEPEPPTSTVAVSTDFEGASLGSWRTAGADTVYLTLRNDTNATTRFWFNFQVRQAAGTDLVFRLPAADNMYGAGVWPYKQPVASTDGGATWSRITDTGVSNGFFEFRYRPVSDSDQIALTLPYDFSRWQAYLAGLAGQPLVRETSVIGRSLDGNPLHMVEITDTSVVDDDKAWVWAMARLHPGEPEGSFMIEGLMDWLLGGNSEATALLREARVMLVPFMNPDGVLAGNQRVNLAGLDLNRQWASTETDVHPTIDSTRAQITRRAAEGSGVRIVLDFHGAPPTRANFFYYNDAASVEPPLFDEMQDLLTRAITLNPDFAALEVSGARGIGAGDRTRSWAYRFLGSHGLTIEGSGADTPYGPSAGQQMTEERYLALGAAVGRAVADELFN